MIDLLASGLTARIDPLGARLTHLGFASAGAANLLLEGPPGSDWGAHYGGVLIGPLANRVADGRAMVEGAACQMPRNEGTTCLHSGPEGLHRRTWEVAGQTGTAVTLTITLADGDCGLPGTRRFTARFALEGQSLHLDLTAQTDRISPVALAHHPYWALGGIRDLTSSATHYLPVDSAQIPTGEIAPLAGTAFDLSRPCPVPPEIDHNLCWPDAPRDPDAPMAIARGAAATLAVYSNQPGLQVYSGAGLPHLPGGIAPFAAIALEPQNWPNAVNTAHFPSPLLAPGDTYHQWVRYALTPAAQ